MASFLKLRPVGNRVPSYRPSESGKVNWHSGYEVVFLDSGTSALSVAVKLAIESVKPVGTPEVLIPAYGCPDLVSAIVAQGAVPVFIDLIPNRPWMDVERIRKAISGNTVGIVAVNFLGIPERLTQLSAIARQHGIRLIDDSAQCFPPVSTQEHHADCIVQSFGRGKPINLMGGGALLVKDSMPKGAGCYWAGEEHLTVSGPFLWAVKRVAVNLMMSRIPYSFLARLPFLKLGETCYKPLQKIQTVKCLEGPLNSGIRAFMARAPRHLEYDRILAAGPSASPFTLLPLKCKSENGLLMARYSEPMLRYPILMNSPYERDRLLELFENEGLGVNVLYGRALPEVEGVASAIGISPEPGDFVTAKSFAERLLVLPTHDSVSVEQISRISRILKAPS